MGVLWRRHSLWISAHRKEKLFQGADGLPGLYDMQVESSFCKDSVHLRVSP